MEDLPKTSKNAKKLISDVNKAPPAILGFEAKIAKKRLFSAKIGQILVKFDQFSGISHHFLADLVKIITNNHQNPIPIVSLKV